jgi:acyl-coenzyme A thioesterase PaaI-like protein
MNEIAGLVRTAKETGNVSPLVEAIPYLRFLGVSVSVSGQELIGKMSYADALIGNANLPALHGGAIGALLESTAIFQALWESETMTLPKIVTITIDFLRSARPTDTFAKSTITKQGRKVVNVSAEAWQEDASRPIARAHAIFLVEPINEA